VGGVERGWGRLIETAGIESTSLVITDTQNEAPSTATFEARGWTPTVGLDVIIRLGSLLNTEREFGGTILSATQGNVGSAANIIYQVSCIDYTWGLNKRKVTGHYSGSATTIAQALIADYATGYTDDNVEAGMGTVDGGITFTMQDVTDCLTQLMKRMGGSWYCDYTKDIHAWVTADPATLASPRDITAAHPSLSHVVVTRDISQVVTRVFVEGGGGTTLSQVAVGETIIPVNEPEWYSATGGVVKSGPQRITYTSVDAGGGGGMVGPGAAPSSAMVLALGAGAGVNTGEHGYAVTFVTGAGESIASPVATITTGAIAAPSSAPTAASPAPGSGPDTGTHYYATTFVNAAGETTSSPVSNTITTEPVTTGEIAAPEAGPTAGTPSIGAGPDAGAHYYAVTFGNAVGETTTSPNSATKTTGDGVVGYVDEPVSGSVVAETDTSYSTWYPGATIQFAWAYINAQGTTLIGPVSNIITATASIYTPWAKSIDLSSIPVSGDATVTGKRRYIRINGGTWYGRNGSATSNATTSLTGVGDSANYGVANPASNTATILGAWHVIGLSSIPIGPTGTTKRHLYRTAAGGSQLKLLATINNNTTTTHSDTTADASLGANIPTSNTTATTTDYNKVSLSAIPLGDATVTSRKLHRTAAGGSQLKLLATLADNTTTTYVDQVIDSSLGANIPTSNTATANRVALSSIPIGPTGVTSRNIYRTEADAAQLKLQSTIADNTTTVLTDSTADASLTTNVPTSDSSGLTQPDGQVGAGATSIVVAGSGAFKSGGGWAVIGNGRQVIRYSGKTDTTLTGVPATGEGAITASIGYNSTITAAPQITGVPASGTGAILYPLLRGDDVNILIQRDDTAAQAVLADYIGGDGIQEDYIQDRRLARAECETRGDAQLALRSAPDVGLTYRSRDRHTGAGRPIVVDLAAPTSVSGTFMIQRVTISNFVPAIQPNYDVTAASDLYTFEDLLRRARKE